MCHTERFQQLDGRIRSWTFRTTHLEGCIREDLQTFHFDCGDAECSVAVAWHQDRIVCLKLNVRTEGDLPKWDDQLGRDAILGIYCQSFPGTPDGVPYELREFLLHVPRFINMIYDRDGDIVGIKDEEFAAFDRSLSRAATFS